jgi:transposase
MSKVTKAAPHLTLEEIDQKIKITVGFWRVQRWLIIRHALVDPKPASEIALHVGLSTQTVHNLISQYNRYGAKAIETPGKGRRQRAYMSLVEEKEFLSYFLEKAQSGKVSTVKEIKDALEKKLGRCVHDSTVYRLLSRQGWRKIVPRPRHVKADPLVQEAFKKTLPKK